MADNFNPITLRKARIAYNFGLSGCNRVNSLLTNGLIHPIWRIFFPVLRLIHCFRVSAGCFHSYCIEILANSVGPILMLHSAVSALGLFAHIPE